MDWQQWFYLSKNDMWCSDKTLQSDGIHMSAGRLGIRVAPPISTNSENGRLQRGTKGNFPDWTCNIFNCTCQGMCDYYGVIPTKTFGCAPPEARTWWVHRACTATPHFAACKGPGCALPHAAPCEHPQPGPAPGPGGVQTRVDMFPGNASMRHTLTNRSGTGASVSASSQVLENNAIVTTLTCHATTGGECPVELLLSDTDANHYHVAQAAGAVDGIIWWRKDNLRQALNGAYVGSCDPSLPLQSVERRFTVGSNGALSMVNGSCLWYDGATAPALVTSGNCAESPGRWTWDGPANKGDILHSASSKCLTLASSSSEVTLGPCGAAPWSQVPSGSNASQVYLATHTMQGPRCLVVVPDNNNNTLGVAVGVVDAGGSLVPGKAELVSNTDPSAGVTLSLLLQVGTEYTIVTALQTLRDIGCAGIRSQWQRCHQSPELAAVDLVRAMASASARGAAVQDSAAFWDTFWNASSVDLTAGAATANKDAATVERWYFLNQFLLGCTTRNGKATSALDGFVCIEPVPWNDQFTLDYNLEATFWGAGSSNRLDFIRPVMASTTNPGAVAVARLRARNPAVWNRAPKWPGLVGNTVAGAECDPACPNLTSIGFNGTEWSSAAMPLGDLRVADSDLQTRFVGGLLATNLIQFWEYSRNLTVLRDTIYPFVKDNAEFYLSYAQPGPNGKLQFPFSCAQEYCSCRNGKRVGPVPVPNSTLQCKNPKDAKANCPRSKQSPCYQCAPDIHTDGGVPDGNHNAHPDIAFASYLLRNAARFATLLKVDSDRAEAWQAGLNAMPAYPSTDLTFVAGAKGEEFNGGPGFLVEAEYGHHAGVTPENSSTAPLVWPWCNSEYPIANYAAVWPTDEIGITQTSDVALVARAKQTVFALNDYQYTPWANINGFCQSWPPAVRLSGRGDSQRLLRSIAGAITAVTGNNGCGTFKQGRGMLENIGATAAVNDLLLQSHGHHMRFFPAWNATVLGPASFTTLRAYGAFLISGAIDGRGVVNVISVLAEVGGDFVFESPWPGSAVPRVMEGGSGGVVPVRVVTPGVYLFITSAGAEYTISNGNSSH